MTLRHRSIAALVLLLALASAACGQQRDSVTGVVIEVEGGIADVSGFMIRLPDGTDLRLVPAEGLLFADGSPMSHLRDHLRSGEPVVVQYEINENGTAVANAVSD